MTIESFARSQRLRKVKLDKSDGTQSILGRYGQIYEYDDELLSVMVMPNPPRKQYWGFARTALLNAGCQLHQNGDQEGSFLFDPKSPEQVAAAIKAAGCYYRVNLSTEAREKKRVLINAARDERGTRGCRNAR